MYYIYSYIYTYRRLGGESNWEIVSFRSCVRAQLYVRSEWISKMMHIPFPFSLLPWRDFFPFPLWHQVFPFPCDKWGQGDPSEIQWVQMRSSQSKWNQMSTSEIKWVQVNPSESKWVQVSSSEIHWVQVRSSESKWVQVRPSESKWDQVRHPLPPILLSNFSWRYQYMYVCMYYTFIYLYPNVYML